MMFSPASKTAVALSALLAATVPGQARACGGFFCNQPTNPDDLPVAQTGENVLFAMSRTGTGAFQLEAHVQIAYTGPADRFSWVVPVDTKPELDVGSDAVFTRLLQATEPRFGVEWKEEGKCRTIPQPPGNNEGVSDGRPPQAGGGTGSAADPSSKPGVDVSFQGAVGPYDAAVIKSTSTTDSKPLLDWLAENKYFVSAEGSKLIADYVREDKFFVAIRLMNGAGVSQIQPLVMRFLGPGPCIPLRLTAIAALADLQINLWVLGEHRVVPDNFYEVQLNEAAISWLPGMGGRSYDELIKKAANEAGGNAFVTDYAGPANILKGQLFSPGNVDTRGIAAATTPPDALDAIGQTGIPRDSRLMELLRMYIPLPEALKQMGVDERSFYNQLRSYWQKYQSLFAPFDAAMLAAAIEARFVTPLRKAQALIDGFATLTRLRTFISPEEMSQDPTFVMNPTLPPVPVERMAKAFLVCGQEQFTRCDAPVRLELPGGTELWLKPQPQPECYPWAQTANQYDGAVAMSLPALSVGWKRDDSGAGVERFNNQAVIQQTLTRHNDEVKAYANQGACDCHLGRGRSGNGGLLLVVGVVLGLGLRRRRR
jgi:hypothetical protein